MKVFTQAKCIKRTEKDVFFKVYYDFKCIKKTENVQRIEKCKVMYKKITKIEELYTNCH